jgi:hypothetical protein
MAITAMPAFAQVTTRIEARPVYGATVTEEEGVRVFRPLPPQDRVIINPDGTPLSLGFSESYSFYNGPPVYAPGGEVYARPGYGGAWTGGQPRGDRRQHRHHRGHGRSHGGTR